MSSPLDTATLIGISNSDDRYISLSTASAETLSSEATLTRINELTVYTSKICRSICEQTIKDVTVIISPGATTGDITFTQRCVVADVNCVINSMVDVTVADTLAKLHAAATSADAVNLNELTGYGVTPAMLKSPTPIDILIKTQIIQMIAEQCTFSSNQTISEDYVYVGSGATTGDISFSQSSTLSSLDCAIDVLGKNATYNRETAGTPASGANLILFFLFIIIGIIVLFVIITSVFYSTNKATAPEAETVIVM
jgi:hypothetical protein